MKKNTRLYSFFLLTLITVCVYPSDRLVIIGESYPPYLFSLNGKVTGIDADVADHVFTKLGIDHEIRIYPWKRCWNMLADGEADAGVAVSNQQNRSEFVYFPVNAVWTADFKAFTLNTTKERYRIESLEDIRDNRLKLGIVNGNSYYPGFWKIFSSPFRSKGMYYPQPEPVTTAEQNFRKLAAGRIDIFIIPETVGLYILKSLGLRSDISSYDTVFFSKSYPNVFSRKSGFSASTFPSIYELAGAYDSELEKLLMNSGIFSESTSKTNHNKNMTGCF